MARKKSETENEVNNFDMGKFEKEINTYIENKKALIVIELEDKIDEKVEAKINRRLKEEEKKLLGGLKRKVFISNILLLAFFALSVYFGYCLLKIDYFGILPRIEVPVNPSNDKNNSDEETPNKDGTIEEEEPKETIYDTAYYVKQYGYLVDNIWLEDESIKDLLKSNTTIQNMSSDLKLKIAYKNLNSKDITVENGMFSFTQDALLESAKKILGKNVSLNNEMFEYGNSRLIYYNGVYLGMEDKGSTFKTDYEIIFVKEENEKLRFEIDVEGLGDIKKVVIVFEKEENIYKFSKVE